MALLEVRNLRTSFDTATGVSRAVNDVSFHINEGEIVAIVGESGSGKSVTANSIMRLVPQPPARITGEILFDGSDILKLPARSLNALRGKDISMIFQEPMMSLNPVLKIGYQLRETLKKHENLSTSASNKRAIELLALVGLSDPSRRMNEYPHQLSGGMCQRVMIAIALACNPKLLIADEPTTALDVTIQAQVLDLMRGLRDRTGAAMMLITHDLGVVAELAERVVVMYAGRIMEEAPVADLLEKPRHPYTKGLIAAVPRLGSSANPGQQRLNEIPGLVPNLKLRIVGCVFAERCKFATQLCREQAPAYRQVGRGHNVSCHYDGEEMFA